MTNNLTRAAMLAMIATAAIAWTTSISAQTAGPKVKIADGTLHGVATSDVEYFKGIPYAAPPVGNLRWRDPQPVKSPSG